MAGTGAERPALRSTNRSRRGASRDTVVSSIRMIRTLKLSLWLPIGVVVLSVIRFGFDPSFSTGFVPMLFSLPAMVFGLVFAWPGGIPLTRALERLHLVSRPATYACAAVLCPLSVGAATIGGLFGPPRHLDLRRDRLAPGVAGAVAPAVARPPSGGVGRQRARRGRAFVI